jgi:hypothetical protein
MHFVNGYFRQFSLVFMPNNRLKLVDSTEISRQFFSAQTIFASVKSTSINKKTNESNHWFFYLLNSNTDKLLHLQLSYNLATP